MRLSLIILGITAALSFSACTRDTSDNANRGTSSSSDYNTTTAVPNQGTAPTDTTAGTAGTNTTGQTTTTGSGMDINTTGTTGNTGTAGTTGTTTGTTGTTTGTTGTTGTTSGTATAPGTGTMSGSGSEGSIRTPTSKAECDRLASDGIQVEEQAAYEVCKNMR